MAYFIGFFEPEGPVFAHWHGFLLVVLYDDYGFFLIICLRVFFCHFFVFLCFANVVKWTAPVQGLYPFV